MLSIMATRSRSTAVLERAGSKAAGSSAYASRPADPRTLLLIHALKARLQELYGTRLKRLILFGSRARGDFDDASDLDLAIVLEPPVGRPFVAKCEVIDATYDLFLDSGIFIQPWPVSEDWLDEPETSPYPHIVRAIVREGIEA
jgi:predicted nucleotidyltransferase